ncbi:hypothetical protein [Clostridium tertium]
MERYDENDKDFLSFVISELELNPKTIVALKVERELFAGISEVLVVCKDKQCKMPATNDCIYKVNGILYEMATEYNFDEGLEKIKKMIKTIN